MSRRRLRERFGLLEAGGEPRIAWREDSPIVSDLAEALCGRTGDAAARAEVACRRDRGATLSRGSVVSSSLSRDTPKVSLGMSQAVRGLRSVDGARVAARVLLGVCNGRSPIRARWSLPKTRVELGLSSFSQSLQFGHDRSVVGKKTTETTYVYELDRS